MNEIKVFSNIEVINIVSFVNKVMTDEQKAEMPTKMRWYLKKNMDKLMPLARKFEEFRDAEIVTLQEAYFTEEKSEEFMDKQVDENGVEQEVPMRKVKDEYMGEYTEAVNELNKRLQEILVEKNEVEIATADLDAFVETLPDDAKIDIDCLNILSFMDENTNVKEEA